MVTLQNKALDKEIRFDREIGRFGRGTTGPTLIFFGGVHGNEPSGVFALHDLFNDLARIQPDMSGRVIGLAGNMTALAQGRRFIERDLNRLWHREQIHNIQKGKLNGGRTIPDVQEQVSIYDILHHILQTEKGPFYFVDLHTTSAESIPFVTLNDTLRNREFAMRLPVPIILGIEEFLSGPLMSYINELGHIALGFEAGSHDALQSITNHYACSWLVLEAAGLLKREDIPDFQRHYDTLHEQSNDGDHVFEIRFRYHRTEHEHFEMRPGFRNFQEIRSGEWLATNDKGKIYARENGRIFLPLYQKQGEDGYFIIREIHPVWLKVSAFLRRYHFDRLLKYLPGITIDPENPHRFRTRRSIARWHVVDFFHLLGYRRAGTTKQYHYFVRRAYDTEAP
ncbi:MAG: aspartoacylase [Calditrichaeota bacterium]|nr:MAG: aspartoacylase [Calditrichota bacterium]